MSPIAGKPPFATDEPDSFYETPRPTQPRIRQPAPPNPNSRTSAYDVYENYLADDKNKLSAPTRSSAASRDSGIGALGMGLLNMGDDSDDDSDDEDIPRKPTSPPPGIAPLSKNAALAAATGVTTPTTPSQPSPPPPPPQAKPPQQDEKRPPPRGLSPNPSQGPPPPPPYVQQMRAPMPPPQQQLPPRPLGPPHPQQQQMQMHNNPPHPQNQRPPPPGPQPIAAPRPGYAAPIAALNLARPEAAAAPGGRQGGAPPPPPLTIQNPFEPAFAGPGRPPGSLSPTPHPLLPPVTPITPAFIRPASKSPTPINVSFKEGVATPRPRKPIMRGNSEETLLPSRGEKGDDFWRRFSMVAKQDSRKKESSWLKKTRDGSERHSRSVWIVGIILLLCIGAGITLGVYFSRKSPGSQQPMAMGGSADNTAGPTTMTTPVAKKTGVGANGPSSSVLHVSPTNTVARRVVEEEPTPVPTPTPAPFVLRMHAKRRLDARDVW